MMATEQTRLTKMPKFKVGQIVYVLNKEQQTVWPAQISCENKKKTKEGLEVTYTAVVGTNGEKQKEFIIDVNNVDIIFDTARKIQLHLINDATETINGIVEVAVEAGKLWYDDNFDPGEDDDDDDAETNKSQPYVSTRPGPKVQLDDGSIVNVTFAQPRSDTE